MSLHFTMSLREALRIQGEQVDYYGKLHPQGVEGLRSAVAKANRVPAGADLDAMRPTWEVNGMVPRGVDIERMVGLNPLRFSD